MNSEELEDQVHESVYLTSRFQDVNNDVDVDDGKDRIEDFSDA